MFYKRKKGILLGIVVLAATFTVYQPAWNGGFLWDDEGHITAPELRSFEGLRRIWTEPGATQQYYPLVHTVFWTAHRAWGDATLGYHLLNILLHLFSAFIIAGILRLLKIPGAWFIAAVFALHPVQVESVAWMTELKNTLSGFFFFSAILVYLRFDSGRKKGDYVFALSFFLLGLLSKSVVALLPVSLMAIMWWKRGRIRWKQDAAPLLPFFLFGMVSGLFTVWVERRFIGAEGEEFTLNFAERCLVAGRAFWFYLGKIFLPVKLVFIYPRWNVDTARWWQYLYPAGVLALAVVFYMVRSRSRAPLAAMVCFAAVLFPVLGFFDVYPFRFSFVADHFQYLAVIFPVTVAAAGIGRVAGLVPGERLRIPVRVFAAVLLVVLGALTWKQSGIYKNSETLYRAIIDKNPGCWMAHNNLGLVLMNDGRFDEAVSHYRKAAETGHDQHESYNNCGIALMRLGRTDEAIDCYRKALQVNPNFIIARYNLGFLLARTGSTDEAAEHAAILDRFAAAFLRIGQRADAKLVFQKALEIAKMTGRDTLIQNITAELDKTYR